MNPEIQFDQILYHGHPSFGTSRALFMFALGDGPTRILFVEAKNPWAVLCLERILLDSGRVSENCRVISVARDYTSVGTRDGMAEEIPYVDFCCDMVDSERLLEDVVTLHCFKQSLTPVEMSYAQLKFQAMEDSTNESEFFPEESGVITVQAETPMARPVLPEAAQDTEKLSQVSLALVGLGFKKSEIRKYIDNLDGQESAESIHALVRNGLRKLAA